MILHTPLLVEEPQGRIASMNGTPVLRVPFGVVLVRFVIDGMEYNVFDTLERGDKEKKELFLFRSNLPCREGRGS